MKSHEKPKNSEWKPVTTPKQGSAMISFKRNPINQIAAHLDGALGAGQVAVIVAKAGVGKSALLVHVALDALFSGKAVLHISLSDTVEHVRNHYDEIFRALSRAQPLRDRANALLQAERNRMINSYRDKSFSMANLNTNLKMLDEVAQFKPEVIVVDGLDSATASEFIEGLQGLASEIDAELWLTLRSKDGIPKAMWPHCAVGLHLASNKSNVTLSLQRSENAIPAALPVELDAATMLANNGSQEDEILVGLNHLPSECTLYSGGAKGAETAFGEEAERWGIDEINFSFDGHPQSRDKSRYELSARELAAGDVSLLYVSQRLHRSYNEGSLIRKVLETIWHMVSRSQQVFVIGEIQEDGTVTGGTGWSVELARMWNKPVWVFDQSKENWFRWDGESWAAGTPVLRSIHFAGTGTRYMQDSGRKAIRELFEHSFSN